MQLHYVFGMASDFGRKPWCYAHYLSVLSAVRVNNPECIHFWYEHEPTGEWWERTVPFLTLHQIKAPLEIFGRPLMHTAHRADVVRLEKLREYGGVYLDADVWCLRPFAELKHNGFWMGWQGTRQYGLCNATMGGDAGTPFLEHWYAKYRKFRSLGRDKYWDEHSVRLPKRLAYQRPQEITLFPYTHFFWPDWNKIHEVFRGNGDYLRDSYSVHLWETFSYHWLAALTPDTFPRFSEIGRRFTELGVI